MTDHAILKAMRAQAEADEPYEEWWIGLLEIALGLRLADIRARLAELQAQAQANAIAGLVGPFGVGATDPSASGQWPASEAEEARTLAEAEQMTADAELGRMVREWGRGIQHDQTGWAVWSGKTWHRGDDLATVLRSALATRAEKEKPNE